MSRKAISEDVKLCRKLKSLIILSFGLGVIFISGVVYVLLLKIKAINVSPAIASFLSDFRYALCIIYGLYLTALIVKIGYKISILFGFSEILVLEAIIKIPGSDRDNIGDREGHIKVQ